MKLEDARREYSFGSLCRDALQDSPFAQLQLWMKQAIELGIQDPTAMSLATATPDGHPWQRIVLLKGLDDQSLVFYTHFGSRKAKEMHANPQVSVLFPWLQIDRQIIVAGRVERVSEDIARRYFLSRPRESQLAAWASEQSTPLTSRAELESQWEAVKARFEGQDIPLPDNWGGYRLVPHEFQFWQGGERRLHDRFQYTRTDSGEWRIVRLAP